MKKQIGIIADDLTGANDSGVQLTKKGIKTSVLFDIPLEWNNVDGGLVIDTNSRALAIQDAITLTEQAGLFLKKAGYSAIYKKMDSTLRGYIGTELQTLYDIFKPEFVFIAPAFPSLGRTTKAGIHYVNGVKLADTEISKDPKHPVTNSSIPALLEAETGRKVGLLKQADIYSDTTIFENKINAFKENGIYYIVCDAETQDDLREAAVKMNAVSNRIIWAGSAGLAEVIPDVLQISKRAQEQASLNCKHVMTVCGSLSQVTQSQVQFAANQPNITVVELDPMQIFSDEWKIVQQDYIQRCLGGFDKGNDVVLYVPSNEEVREKVKEIGTNLNLTGYQIGERISGAIGEVVEKVSQKNYDLTGFVLTGGDTAKDTSRHLDGIGFQLIKEVESGIPYGRLIGTNKEYMVVTKAGAFGKEDSIYKAMMMLKGVL
ncbi:hypothetical protein F3157_02090 [Virgibacillus dakarensis]|nr:hypothetical protein [Virgibacillus dakarensis]